MSTELGKQHIEISLISLILLLWQRKILIILVTVLFTTGGVVYSLSIPNQYKAEVMLIPSEEGQSGGLSALANQFGGLAGMAGLNLSGDASKKPKIALQLLKSKSFLIDFVKRHNLDVLIFASEKWDAKTNTVLLDEDLYDVNTQKWVREFNFPKKLTPSEQEIYRLFVKMIDSKFDNREGTYRISVEYFSPYLAATWANLLVEDINEKMRQVDIIQANKSIEYLKLQLKNTNLKTTESVFFGLIEEQTKKSMLAQVQEDYVFVVIDPAMAPEKKSNPKRALICILFLLLGGLIASGYVFFIHFRGSESPR